MESTVNNFSIDKYEKSKHELYLTTNYTIDFIKNIKLQKCFSNLDCPHYSNGCYLPLNIFNRTIRNSNVETNLYDKDSLLNNNIYGYCLFSFLCPENEQQNNKDGNLNCYVTFNGKEEEKEFNNDFIYSNELLVNSLDYPLKKSFFKNNITSPYYCTNESLKYHYCPKKNEIHCLDNTNCLTQVCEGNQCLKSNKFTMYNCKPRVTEETLFTDTIGTTECKKLNQELSQHPFECLSNFTYKNICWNKEDQHAEYTPNNLLILNIIPFLSILTGILVILVAWGIFRNRVLNMKKKKINQ